MKKALEHVLAATASSSKKNSSRHSVLPPLVGVKGDYTLPPEVHLAPLGPQRANIVVVGTPTPWNHLEFLELIREADDWLRVGGYIILTGGYRYFQHSVVGKRYVRDNADPLRIWRKVSLASTPWLQRGIQTSDEHYTYLFNECANLFGEDVVGDMKVLSFGCSSGEEVRCLKKRGFAEVHGVEINPAAIAKARAADPKGVYVEDLADLPGSAYNLIFTVAVLCSFPSRDPVGEFPFATFAKTVAALDSRLVPGGYLVIGSAQYDFRDVKSVAGRYKAIILDNPFLKYASGRVPKWSPDGFIRPVEATTSEGAVPVVFQKLSS